MAWSLPARFLRPQTRPQPIPDPRPVLERTLGGAYTIERELGGGGMSFVYLAEETALGRRVVIKVLPPDLAHAVSSERFRQEIRLAARLTHPHIVPLLAAGDSEGIPWYTMPYVEGESLRARLARGPLPIPEVVGLLRDVAQALTYAHEHAVVHRDIKPDNVLLIAGSAMVTDFGVAKALSAATDSGQSGLTGLGVVLGTPAYMAPEQGAGDPATDHRADIYAFGCLAYEALTGAPPFGIRPPAALIAAHTIEAPQPVARRRPDVPPALAELVMRCLAKDAADRPQTAAAVLEALDGIHFRGHARRWHPAALAAALVILAVAALIFLPPFRRPAVPPSRPLHSIAVLPFENIGGDPEDEYFSDGMTDELAHALAGLPDIRVAGRTSSYAYKGKPAPVQEIGRALGVAGVIAGTVRRAGDRLRVTVQLSSASDGFQRWSEEYERQASDVFVLQDELTRAIVAELEPTLRGAAPRVASEARGTADPVAYEHYLRARYFWQRRGTQALLTAIDEYRAAIARDSAYARAWAGTALIYVVLPSYAPLNADSVNALGIAAARRALELDSTIADAHLALANALGNQLRLDDAEAETRRVIALAPNDPTAHQWHSSLLHAQGRVDDALEASRRAVALDPLSAVILNDQAVVLMSARRYPEAFAASRRALQLDSTYTYIHAVLAWLHGVTGRPDSALAQLGLDPPADPASTWRGSGWRGMAAWAYGLAGRRADVERVRAEIAREPGGGVGYDLAMAAMALGDFEGAVAGLAKSLQRHELLGMEASPGCTPVLDPLRGLRSYRELMRRYGIRVCEPSREAAMIWRGFKSDTLPDGWQLIDGVLTRVAPAGDIVTGEQFQDFELALEWKVKSGGNSGVFYRVSEARDLESVWQSGPEAQVLDDAGHPDGAKPETSAGACYGLYPAPRGVVRAAGEWNAMRILVQGSHVEHWLNGRKVVDYELGSLEWEERVRRSKFARLPRYGREPRGHIALQDHGDWVAYRNIRIRALPPRGPV